MECDGIGTVNIRNCGWKPRLLKTISSFTQCVLLWNKERPSPDIKDMLQKKKKQVWVLPSQQKGAHLHKFISVDTKRNCLKTAAKKKGNRIKVIKGQLNHEEWKENKAGDVWVTAERRTVSQSNYITAWWRISTTWGCISTCGLGDRHRIDSALNADKYIVKHHTIPTGTWLISVGIRLPAKQWPLANSNCGETISWW